MRRRARAAGLALLGLPALALAQEGAGADAVVVTATRVPQPSLEIPASIDRLYEEDIRVGRPQVNLSESLGVVPGIVVQNRNNYAQDLQIQSRGFGARSTFGVRGIRLYADGIPANQPDGQGQTSNFDLGSAERIEVLRGPFSSLYGNSAGGVIRIDTEDGPPVPTLEGDLYSGSYGMWRAAGRFGGQYRSLNGIGSLSRFHIDGYREHSAATRDLANAKLRYDATGDTSVTLVANAVRQPETQDPQGLNRAQLEQDRRQVQPGVITFDTRKTIRQDQGGLRLQHRLSADNDLEAVAYVGNRFVEQFLAFSNNGVVNLDTDYGGAALRFFRHAGTLRLSVGAEYDAMQQRRKGFNNLGGVAGALTRDEDDDVTSSGLYAQADWRFAERWSLLAGLRTTRVEFEITDLFGAGANSGSLTYSDTTPVAGLVFRLSPQTSVYGNLGRGFETPTLVEIANSASGTGPNLGLQASRSRHAELGLKTVAGGWARINAAMFNIVTENEIVVDQNIGGRAIFKNVGHTDRDGFELSVDTVGSGPWHARLAYTWLDARFRESFTTLVQGAPVSVPAGTLIAGVPKNVLYGELGYNPQPFFARLEGLHKSSVPVNDANSDFADAYTVWNAVAGLTQRGARWRVTEFARIDNLTDRLYVGSLIVNDNNGRYFEPAPERAWTLGVQAALQF
ncbi:MAG TPA: TonB-dependent receptor [Burkholderiales bacterium]|nr:TonB-dependent receptor [Burkholderiales bacterium]